MHVDDFMCMHMLSKMFVDVGCIWMICMFLDFYVLRSEEDIPEVAPFGIKLIIYKKKIQNIDYLVSRTDC